MCEAPSVINGIKVPCRRCSMCRGDRVQDFVGRCMAERFTSTRTLAVTLTYAGDSVNAATLQYRDVQLMLKRLRTAGHAVRYICAGEYGAAKARAHWHIVLFFSGAEPPELPLARRIDWRYWPHGFTYAQEADHDGFAYVMKYCLKNDRDATAHKTISMSKYPPLGTEFFESLADDMVSQGLAFHSPEYAFADDMRYNERTRSWGHRRYWARNASLWLWMERYVSEWRSRYSKPIPDTEFLSENYFDVIAAGEMAADPFFVERAISLKTRPRLLEAELSVYPKQIGFLLCSGSQRAIFVLFDDRSVHFSRGGQQWLLSGNGSASLHQQLDRLPGLDRSDRSAFLVWYGLHEDQFS